MVKKPHFLFASIKWSVDLKTPDEWLADYFLWGETTDPILIGTSGVGLIEGKDAVHSYFARLANSGDKVAIDALNVIMLHDDAVYVTGLYTFGGLRHDQPRTTQAAFTMVLIKRGNDWLIAHHHSSRRSAPASAAPPLRKG